MPEYNILVLVELNSGIIFLCLINCTSICCYLVFSLMWYSLPAALRLDMSLSVFRTRLKTFLMTSYNACNSRHGAFAASFEFAPYKW